MERGACPFCCGLTPYKRKLELRGRKVQTEIVLCALKASPAPASPAPSKIPVLAPWNPQLTLTRLCKAITACPSVLSVFAWVAPDPTVAALAASSPFIHLDSSHCQFFFVSFLISFVFLDLIWDIGFKPTGQGEPPPPESVE